MTRVDHARSKRRARRRGDAPIATDDRPATRRQLAALERMAVELAIPVPAASTRAGASAAIANLAARGATPPRHTQRGPQRLLSRAAVAAHACPRCLALIGEACRNVRGGVRKGHHLERVKRALDAAPE